MKKTLYDGIPDGAYIDGNFFKLMNTLWPDSMLLNQAFPIHPNPNNLPRIGYVVNVWHPDEVTVLYTLKCDWKDQTCQYAEGVLITVVLDGEPAKLGEVEKKIVEGISRKLYN
jgi:hypothetical protein